MVLTADGMTERSKREVGKYLMDVLVEAQVMMQTRNVEPAEVWLPKWQVDCLEAYAKHALRISLPDNVHLNEILGMRIVVVEPVPAVRP